MTRKVAKPPKKRGRPKKDEDRSKRTRLLSVRYNAEEFDRLCRLASKSTSLSDYVRERSLERQTRLVGT